MNAGNRSVLLPDAFWRILRGYGYQPCQVAPDIFFGKRRIRYTLKQQRLDSGDSVVAMKAPLHDAAVKHVVERQQRHSLVMRHVGENPHAPLTFARTLAGEVDGFV